MVSLSSSPDHKAAVETEMTVKRRDVRGVRERARLRRHRIRRRRNKNGINGMKIGGSLVQDIHGASTRCFEFQGRLRSGPARDSIWPLLMGIRGKKLRQPMEPGVG